MAETRLGDNPLPKFRDIKTMEATGNRIQVQGTALLENCLFILPKKTKGKESTFSTSITWPRDTDLSGKDLY